MKKDLNNEEILAMLSDITNELDYDIWKELFGPMLFKNFTEDLSYIEKKRDNLINIVRKHLEKGK